MKKLYFQNGSNPFQHLESSLKERCHECKDIVDHTNIAYPDTCSECFYGVEDELP